MRWVHQATAYILRWNKKDYKEIIGVFLTERKCDEFMLAHFTSDEIHSGDLIVERGRQYELYLR